MSALLKACVKKVAAVACGDYSIYRIYELALPDLDAIESIDDDLEFRRITDAEVRSSPDATIAEQAGYCGEEALIYGCLDEGRVVAVCCYWYGDRYRTRNFWPLQDDQAKLVQVLTLPEFRGRRIAPRLIARSASELLSGERFRRLFARIWHSNTPSIRAFELVGWRWIATVTEVFPPLRRRKALRFVRRAPGAAAKA